MPPIRLPSLLMATCVLLAACAHQESIPPAPRVATPVAPAEAADSDPDVLWRLVHGTCVPAARQGLFPPAPCAEVTIGANDDDGYAVFKDRNGRYQYLVLPTARISGIETPALVDPGARNYFADAWNARLYVEAALHRPLPREAVLMAVNSTRGRSQHQLHIHIDCIRADVRDALQRQLPALDERWRPLAEPLPPNGHAYLARWVAGDSLSLNPFASLAKALGTDDPMALRSLAVAGARSPSGTPGFILLSGRFDPDRGDRANSEELQDRLCTVAGGAASAGDGNENRSKAPV